MSDNYLGRRSFVFRVKMGNVAMSVQEDIEAAFARAMSNMRSQLDRGEVVGGKVFDENGNSVGMYTLVDDDFDPSKL